MAGLPTCSIFLSQHAVFQTELSGELGQSFLQHPHDICRTSRSLWIFVFAVTVGHRSCHPLDVAQCARSLCNRFQDIFPCDLITIANILFQTLSFLFPSNLGDLPSSSYTFCKIAATAVFVAFSPLRRKRAGNATCPFIFAVDKTIKQTEEKLVCPDRFSRLPLQRPEQPAAE